MLISQQKRKENIVEYLLYMWQVEDIIRACDCDIDRIDASVVSQYDADPDTRAQIRHWYEGLAMMMMREGAKERGHLQINKNIIIRLTDFHNALLESPKFPEYRAEYYKALPFIVELRAHSGNEPAGEIETCFNALYGTCLLRLQQRPVSQGTQQAVAQIARWMARLSALFLKDEQSPIIGDDDEII